MIPLNTFCSGALWLLLFPSTLHHRVYPYTQHSNQVHPIDTPTTCKQALPYTTMPTFSYTLVQNTYNMDSTKRQLVEAVQPVFTSK